MREEEKDGRERRRVEGQIEGLGENQYLGDLGTDSEGGGRGKHECLNKRKRRDMD